MKKRFYKKWWFWLFGVPVTMKLFGVDGTICSKTMLYIGIGQLLLLAVRNIKWNNSEEIIRMQEERRRIRYLTDREFPQDRSRND